MTLNSHMNSGKMKFCWQKIGNFLIFCCIYFRNSNNWNLTIWSIFKLINRALSIIIPRIKLKYQSTSISRTINCHFMAPKLWLLEEKYLVYCNSVIDTWILLVYVSFRVETLRVTQMMLSAPMISAHSLP